MYPIDMKKVIRKYYELNDAKKFDKLNKMYSRQDTIYQNWFKQISQVARW